MSTAYPNHPPYDPPGQLRPAAPAWPVEEGVDLHMRQFQRLSESHC